ncbi:hypothetical protein DPV78_010324 [Talaromyces pinophilus]|nr:hypothetical protein DPV78_010324 [Talaromyces pinophilus]
MTLPFNPREGLAMQTTGLNNLPNATTTAVEPDEDDISLTSTAESVFQEEYEVETIHAQDIINGQKVYLVKWKGYEDLRCTWEPRDSFNTKEILLEWRNKRRQIKRGTRQPFDVEAWQAEIEAFENAREDRKRRRREKRARLGLLTSDGQESAVLSPAAAPNAVVQTTAPPSAPLDSSSDNDMPLMNRSGLGQNSPSITNSVQSQSTSQPRSMPPNLPSKPSTPQTTFARPVNQTICPTEKPKALPPKPVDIKVVEGRLERRDLANVLKRARQQPNLPAEKSKPWKLFQTTHRFEKASKQDPEPNRDDLELQRPNTWSPFQMSSFLRKRQEKEDNSPFVEQDEVLETQQTSLPQTPAASIDSPVLPSQRLTAAEQPSAANRSTITPSDPQEIRESPLTESPSDHLAYQHYSPQRSKKWRPSGESLMVGHRKLFKKSDLLCRIAYGSEAGEIGDTLLCDIPTPGRAIIYRQRFKKEIRICFEELCTLDRFRDLSYEINEEDSFNGFIYAYPDTQPDLSDLHRLLLDKDLVAIARITRPSDPDRGLTLVCYPTLSKSFQFLNRDNYISPEDTLRFSGFFDVLPRQPRSVPSARDESLRRKSLQRPELQGRNEDSGRAKKKALAPWRFPSQAIASTTGANNTPLGVRERLEARDPRLEVSTVRKDQAPTVSQIAQPSAVSNTAVTDRDESAAALSDAMGTSSDSSEDIGIITGTEAPVSYDMDIPPPAPVTLTGQYNDQVIPETQDVQMLDVSNAENIDLKELLTTAFLTNYKITYDDIAAVTSHSSIKLANCFYLWFPEDAEGDFQVLEQFLDQHYAIVLSNRKQNDWEKFTKSSSGVALFHHSFLHFSEMPGFHKLTMSSSFNFWTVSLQTAIPNIEPQTHFQRIFPHGTGYLMTEDFMLHERDAAIMVLAWFRDIVLSKFPGTLKMMFRPNVLKWLDRMSKEDPRFAVMAVLIGDTACHGDASNWPVEPRDLDCFFNPSLESPVISPSELPNAGPVDGPSNPVVKGVEQGKDADLLCELFAAWAVLNAVSLRKFLILTHNKPIDRWQKWQHIEIIQGATDFFRKSNINQDHYSKWLAQGSSTPSSSLPPSKSATPALPAAPTAASTAAPLRPGLTERAPT